MGGGDGLGGVGGIELRTGADESACGWVMDLEGLAGGGFDPLTVDVANGGLEEGGVFELCSRQGSVQERRSWRRHRYLG